MLYSAKPQAGYVTPLCGQVTQIIPEDLYYPLPAEPRSSDSIRSALKHLNAAISHAKCTENDEAKTAKLMAARLIEAGRDVGCDLTFGARAGLTQNEIMRAHQITNIAAEACRHICEGDAEYSIPFIARKIMDALDVISH